MTFNRLKWAAILAPIVFVSILQYTNYVLDSVRHEWPSWFLMAGVVLLSALFFYGAVFTVIEHTQKGLARRNTELVALRNAGLDIARELATEVVLQKVVDSSCNLIETRYGALAVIDESDRIEAFVTSGMTKEERHRIGAPPEGRGLLGIVLREGQRLRIPAISSDSRAHGFPPNHPPLRSLLAVPIICRSPFRGNLYLSEKLDGLEFSEQDEETLVRFASQAAIAIDNAHLHRQAQDLAIAEERVRIAREMHDGVAQVLAYCNTKLQAVSEFLKSGRAEEATTQLEQLSVTAREAYADVREGIFALRTPLGGSQSFDRAMQDFVEHWQEQSGIEGVIDVQDRLVLDPSVELQLVRIVQEALANVRKHSRAKRAQVDLKSIDGLLTVSIKDDGVGFDPSSQRRSPTPRFGLTTMRERAEAIGGRLEIESSLGKGTQIRVELPRRESDLGSVQARR